MGGEGGRAGGIICSEKLENYKNSTHTKIQFYIISIFFSMMDITIFTDGGRSACRQGQAGGVIRSEKWENHKDSTHTKIKFPITFISIFFLRWIFKIFLTGGGGGGSDFFYYFINAIISTLHISSFYCCLQWYLAHSYILLYFDVFLASWKSTLLATKNISPPTVFDLGGWNGHHFVGNWVAETVIPFF